ncbi:hypothetical protein COV06_02905 [Candidatus Uhrbacteria bacterium CG10_big_fil_rev_8_21_14_0_10_50_16]|uniref:EF-hand domain-containing protein n=1 Tax=Candidatus Uhrbacteria bacterium CG10_big_fil_rev_8_21_14_0_10_50_16 TaxID=1975039 RepID=A0A2H0RMD8_9BACT|nr:MAG: hypothetical protein COV06_02905 [Candidatus Uhrbacteria bacterium CG10_big_fil_rev_8_21_14_0_10_50_16]
MAQEVKTQTTPTAERQTQAFQVSVMPKEFRGKEGLVRPYVTQQPVVITPPTPKVVPRPEPVHRVTPQQARTQKLVQPPKRKKAPVPWGLIIGGVILLAVLGVGAYWMLRDTTPAVVEPVRTPPPPAVVVPTPPVDTKPPIVTEPEPVSPTDPFAGVALPGQDTDSDGLTDIEEVVYGTEANRPDTDQDGFLDGNEVFNLYHPNGTAPQTLLDTGAVKIVQPDGYQLHALARWTQQLNTVSGLVVITAPTGESFQVLPQTVAASETLNSWYTKTVAIADQQPLGAFRTKQGFVGVWTEDHLTAYVRFSDQQILVFTYNLGNAMRIQYRQTFEMMINSLTKNEEVL